MQNPSGDDLTPISELGEFGLIKRWALNFTPTNKQVLKGIGDDAAVVQLGNGECQLISTDLLLEGIHFDLSYVPLKHLGYKAVVVNLSDIYAMNGTPYGITVSVGMSSRFTIEAMDALYDGVKAACEEYGVDLLGGDTSSSRSGLVISVTALGKASEKEVVYRNGANETDLICVSGDLGAAFAGLQVLEREKSVFLANPSIQPDLVGRDYVIGRQLKPEARKDVVAALKSLAIRPTAMIDLSDGMASDLLHLCQSSQVGANIYEDKLPIDHEVMAVADDFSMSAATFAMNGGEDYELLFTVPLSAYDKIKSVQGIHIIGHIHEAEAGVNLVTNSGIMVPVEAQGWNHFKKD